MTSKIKIAIAEDHLLFRKSVCDYLNKSGLCEVVLEQSTGADIVANLAIHKPDVLILDLQMPDVDGFKALEDIRENIPMQKVIIYSSLFSRALGLKGFGDKIQDYLPKHTSPEEVLEAILRVNSIESSEK